MKVFIVKICIVLFAILLYLFVPSWVLISNKECLPFKQYIRTLEKDQLFGLGYRYYDKPYKYYMTQMVAPQVLALGSSRVMQVGKEMINSQFTFYNAGGAVQNIYEFNLFVKGLEKVPDLIILNYDHFSFNQNFENQIATYDGSVYGIPKEKPEKFFSDVQNIYYDILKGKISFVDIFTVPSGFGLSANIKHDGFRADGTYYYGHIYEHPTHNEDYHFLDTKQRIKEGNRRFEEGHHIDSSLLQPIEEFLEVCRDKKIKVLAIIPPFAECINKEIETSGKYLYMKEIFPALSSIYNKFGGCYVYDYSSVSDLVNNDDTFIDGFHGSNHIYALIIRDIVEKNEELSKYFISYSSFNTLIDSLYLEAKNLQK